MTSFQLPSAIFPENAIKQAELAYQERSAKKLPSLRRWITRTVKWLIITIALIHIGGLLIASLMRRDPTPITNSLGLLSVLLVIGAVYYHFYLMLQTMALTANSITREKESQTWELLVLTGVNARQIVRGKWWATVQRQFSRYLLLGLIRGGAIAAFGISAAGAFSYTAYYNNAHLVLPHPLTILISTVFGILFTIANLGLSAACGVMGSAASKRGSMAIVRGFAIQIVIVVLPAIMLALIFVPIYSRTRSSVVESISSTISFGGASIIDNGFNLVSYPLYVNYQYYNLEGYTPIAPVAVDWMISALVSLALYALLIWFALWRAEKRAVSALATPVS